MSQYFVYSVCTDGHSHHAWLIEDISSGAVYWHTLAGMAIAEAAPSDHHLIEGVVVFILRVPPTPCQQVIPQSEQTCEVDPKVGHGDELYQERKLTVKSFMHFTSCCSTSPWHIP